MLILLTPCVLADYDRSDDYEYEYSFYDTAKTASVISTTVAYMNSETDAEQTCAIASKNLTAPPLTFDVTSTPYTLISGTTFFEIYDQTCTNVADITPGSPVNAEPLTYYYDGAQRVFISYNNNTVQQHVFNGTHLTFNDSYAVSNITGSGGFCASIEGVDYCFYQNTTNDLVRLTLSTGTVTHFTVMSAPVKDLERRTPAHRGTSVYVSGRYNTTTTELCRWLVTTEALHGVFDCQRVSTSTAGWNTITNPAVVDIDGGSADEVIVGYTRKSGNNHIVGLAVYGATGTVKYSTTSTLVSAVATPDVAVFNPLWFSNGSTIHAVTVGQADNGAGALVSRLLRAGPSGTNVLTMPAGRCEQAVRASSGGAGLCDWVKADLSANTSQFEAIGDNIYANLDFRTDTITDMGFNYTSEYFTVADLDSDLILDLLYETRGTFYTRSGVFNNDVPEWLVGSSESPVMNAERPYCANETYTLTALSTDYTDGNQDEVRLFVDVYGDYSYNYTSGYGQPLVNDLNAYVTFNTTGAWTMRVYLQDERQASLGEISTDNLVNFPVSVSSDEDVCNPAGTGTSTGTTTTTTGSTPSQSYANIWADFGLTGLWTHVIWLFVMFLALWGMIQAKVTNPFIIGAGLLLTLTIGWIFGAVSTAVMVIIAILCALIGVVVLFAGRGGG